MYKFTTKWADFDANKHMRHSAYNDFAAEARIRFFNEHGIDVNYFNQHQIGPILFKEETTFLREILPSEDVKVSIELLGVSLNGERWKIRHIIYKENNIKAAQIEVYGAWISYQTRKLTTPPLSIMSLFEALKKTSDYQSIILKNV
ncbi:MAG TPA: thioesterase family protein [Flavobacteriaceae bacterium]|jgi:acyl-CoA thioester hydrolase|nr:thioesterase family protein [Flavobacteriaceae bacterium]HEX5743310.1 thioesterase family protein [Flavobacteriaceae bacterium]